MPVSKSNESQAERKNALHEAASLMGRKGGPAAAKVRFAKMTAEQRQQHGRKLVTARWEKVRREEATAESAARKKD